MMHQDRIATENIWNTPNLIVMSSPRKEVTANIRMAQIRTSIHLFKLFLENEHEIPQTIQKTITTSGSTTPLNPL